jgi:hypothetical protein
MLILYQIKQFNYVHKIRNEEMSINKKKIP